MMQAPLASRTRVYFFFLFSFAAFLAQATTFGSLTMHIWRFFSSSETLVRELGCLGSVLRPA